MLEIPACSESFLRSESFFLCTLTYQWFQDVIVQFYEAGTIFSRSTCPKKVDFLFCMVLVAFPFVFQEVSNCTITCMWYFLQIWYGWVCIQREWKVYQVPPYCWCSFCGTLFQYLVFPYLVCSLLMASFVPQFKSSLACSWSNRSIW